MVKFGRHVDFFVANELDSSRKLYVVPYKEVQHKTCIEIPKEVPPPPPPVTPATQLSSSIASSRNGSRAGSRCQTPDPIRSSSIPQEQSSNHKNNSASGLSALFNNNAPPPKPPDLTTSPIFKPTTSSTNNISSNLSKLNLNDLDLTTCSSPLLKKPEHNAVTLTTGTGAELAAAVKQHLLISQQVVKNPNKLELDDYIGVGGGTSESGGANQQQQQQQGNELDDIAEHPTTATVNNNEEENAIIGGDTTTTNNNKTSMSEEDYKAQAHFFAQRFQTEWRICLKKATVDFDRAYQLFWNEVFEGISNYNNQDDDDDDESQENGHQQQKLDFEEQIRGALPDAALQLYVNAVSPSRAQSTFTFLKDIHATALINAEALRKLVKKFDKMHYKLDKHSYLLSAKLLPEVYASNFTGSLASLEAGLAYLRVLLNIDDDDNDSLVSLENYQLEEGGDDVNDETKQLNKAVRDENRRLRKLATMDDDLRDVAVLSGGYFGNKTNTDEQLVKRRMEELQWLRNMIQGIDSAYIPFLVGHRGFHSIHDRSDVRPLENSLMAYEAAWTNGVHLCECDIALTKDERIILAHDENFARLGMDPTSPLCNRTVRDLTFKELMNLPLKSGARPPLLFDVLRSAMAIGPHAKMIVEIKAGNTEAGSALARMFVRHPQLMEHVAVVMSFDAFIMHNLRREMAAVFEHLHTAQQQQIEQLLPPSLIGGTPAVVGHKKTVSIPISHELEYDNIGPGENPAMHPLKAPVMSNIALGSALSSSPNLGPSIMGTHNRRPSHARFPSKIGGGLGNHNRIDSRDMFGVGMNIVGLEKPSSSGGGPGEAGFGSNLGMSLAEIDTTMSQSSSFLPIHKSVTHLGGEKHEPMAPEEEEKKEKDAHHEPPIVPTTLRDTTIKSFPKLLLITVAEAPKADYELFVDITKPEKIAELDGWLRGGDGGNLDGIYMQFQKAMMGPEGSKTMRNLASVYDVGIWGANPVPDDWDTFHTLVTECHVSYVNSSLPKHFRRKMKRSMSANTLQLNGILANKSYDHL